MSWQNPWAFAGLMVLALPILIHLLSRKRATVQRFPTLRFLNASRLLPTRRTRISDWWLLMLRLAILSAAITALAGPQLETNARPDASTATLARAIVVDTSESMSRSVSSGQRARDAALAEATRLAGEAGISTILQSAKPASVLSAASEWLAAQNSRGEIVVISDFQLGVLDSANVTTVPKHVGVRPVRIGVSPSKELLERRWQSARNILVMRVEPGVRATSAEWSVLPGAVNAGQGGIAHNWLTLQAGAGEQTRLEAARYAAQSIVSAVPGDTAKAVVFVYPEYEQRVASLVTAAPVTTSWMADVITKMRNDSLLLTATSNAVAVVPSRDSARYAVPPPYVVVARNNQGRVIAFAARDTTSFTSMRERLTVYVLADAGSVVSAALIAVANRALVNARHMAELETATISNAVLQQWQRLPTENALTTDPGASDNVARWFWVAALVLLLLENWVRSRTVTESRFGATAGPVGSVDPVDPVDVVS